MNSPEVNITLSGIQAEMQEALIKQNSIKATSTKKNILLVEDDEDQAFVTRQFLEKHNFIILASSDIRSGLSVLKEKKIDLIVLDNMLPGLSGSEFINLLRNTEKDQGFENIPVILIAAGYVTSDEFIKNIEQAAFCPKNEIKSTLIIQMHNLLDKGQ